MVSVNISTVVRLERTVIPIEQIRMTDVYSENLIK